MASEKRFQVKFFSSEGPSKPLRVDDFIRQLENIKVSLLETARVLNRDETSLFLRIVSINYDPPTVTLEADSETETIEGTARVVNQMTANLRYIRKHKSPPRSTRVDPIAMDAYQKMANSTSGAISGIQIGEGRHAVAIDEYFRFSVGKAIGKDRIAFGSISGKMLRLNLSSARKTFSIYPVVGPSKVLVTFPRSLREAVANGADKHVTVFGELRYKDWGRHPYAIKASKIILPPEPGDRILSDLKGMAPTCSRDVSSTEFIEALRDGW